MTDPQPPAVAPQDPAPADGRHSDGWRPLHPATPLLRGGVALVALFGIALVNLRDLLVEAFVPGPDGVVEPLVVLVETGLLPAAIGVVLGGLLLITGLFWLSWRMHTYRITAEAVEVRSGVLFRTSRTARLDRIQTVTIQRSLFARIFGASRLGLGVAGQDATVTLEYLGVRSAEALRQELLDRASGAGAPLAPEAAADVDTPVPPPGEIVSGNVAAIPAASPPPASRADGPEVRIPLHRVPLSVLLDLGPILGAAFAMAWLIVFLIVLGSPGAVLAVIPAVIALIGVVVRRATTALRFRVRDTRDGVAVSFGLASTTAETVPPGRIHAIRIRQPALWRFPGWWRIEVNRAGSSTARSGGVQATTLLPVGTMDEVVVVLRMILDDLVVGHEDAVRAGLTGVGEDGYVAAPRRARLLRPLGWKRTGFTLTGGELLLRSGVLRRTLVIVPQARLQSVVLTQGPLARRLDLAELTAHTLAGPITASLSTIDRTAALQLFDDVRAAAITLGEADTTHRWRGRAA